MQQQSKIVPKFWPNILSEQSVKVLFLNYTNHEGVTA